MEYIIHCCGPSKDFFASTKINIHSGFPLNATALKKMLLAHISSEKNSMDAECMLAACLLASDNKILDQHADIENHHSLFLLPPVCGG